MSPGSNDRIGLAVLGFGRMGRRYGALIGAMPETRLCAVADTDPEAGRGAKADADPAAAVPFFPSLEALLTSPVASEIDVITITTPNGCHADQACRALEAGKHVIVEKPVALKPADAQRILDTAAANGKRVFTVMQNRYARPLLWLKSEIDAGRLGKLNLVQVNAYWNRDRRYYTRDSWHGSRDRDGGVLYTQFSHLVDMVYWLFGEPGDIRSRWRTFQEKGLSELEDTGIVQFTLPGGALGSLQVSTAAWDRNMETSLTVLGQYGSVRIEGQYMERVGYCHTKDTTAPPPAEGPLPPDGNHRRFLENVVDVLTGRARPDADPTDGVTVLDIIGRMYKDQY